MPSIPHEAPLELLRRNPRLVAVLLRCLGIDVPDGAAAAMAPSDLSASVPAELRADAVVVLSDAGGSRLAVVVEVQLRYDQAKAYSWPAYLTQVRAASKAARQALEALMTTAPFRDPFVDRLLAEGEAKGKAKGEAKGRAEGEARMILRVLAARGLLVPAEIRQRVLSCSDISQLEAWGDRAATATSVEDVFGP